jgi:hypothetical protein
MMIRVTDNYLIPWNRSLLEKPTGLQFKTSHSPTNELFIKLGLKFTLEFT